jgi:hypothetical protein
MAPGNGGDDDDAFNCTYRSYKDNPLHFSGEVKDLPTFKEEINDARDTTWLLGQDGRDDVVYLYLIQ